MTQPCRIPGKLFPACTRRAGLGLVLAVLTVGSGCWEEIRYVPNPGTAETADTNAANGEEPKEAVTEGAADSAERLPVEPKLPDAAPIPTPGELFNPEAAVDPTVPTAETPPDTEAAIDAEEAIVPALELPPEASEPEPPTDKVADEAAGQPPVERTATPEERRLAWEAASKWSLAAAIYAKGPDATRYEPILQEALDEATASATSLGVELPPLPAAGDGASLEATAIKALRGEPTATLIESFAERFTPAEAALADLAVRARLLLLTYLPRSPGAAAQAEAIRKAAEASGLPAEVWTPLVKLLDERAPFVDVRTAVFDLDRRAAKHFSAANK